MWRPTLSDEAAGSGSGYLAFTGFIHLPKQFDRFQQRGARWCNLKLERETSDPKRERDSDLVKFTYTASLSGDYRNIRRFIHELETRPEFLVLENVELSQSEAEGRGLNVNLQIATYYRAVNNGG